MSRKLIVENNRQRLYWFERNISGKLHIETHAEGAIKGLKRFTYTHLYLDHDLGLNRVLLKDLPYPNNGVSVVKGVIQYVRDKNTPIIIHSMNIVGAREMWHLLLDNGFKRVNLIPFFVLVGFKEWKDKFHRPRKGGERNGKRNIKSHR